MTTPLRQRMIEDMQLRGLSEKTQDAYVRAVRQLAEHYGKSPDCIGEEELRQYLLYLKNDEQASPSAFTIALCGIKFFYQHTLRREWATFELVRPKREHTLPVVLSVDEVQRIPGCLRLPRYRVCLSTIYTCGLRLQEWLAALGRALPAGRQWLQRPQVPRSLHLPRRHQQPAHPESGGWPGPNSSAGAADAPPSLTPPQSFVRCPACGQAMRPRPLAHPERGQPP